MSLVLLIGAFRQYSNPPSFLKIAHLGSLSSVYISHESSLLLSQQPSHLMVITLDFISINNCIFSLVPFAYILLFDITSYLFISVVCFLYLNSSLPLVLWSHSSYHLFRVSHLLNILFPSFSNLNFIANGYWLPLLSIDLLLLFSRTIILFNSNLCLLQTFFCAKHRGVKYKPQ